MYLLIQINPNDGQSGVWLGRMDNNGRGKGLCLTFGWGKFDQNGQWHYWRWLPVFSREWQNEMP